VAIVAEKVWRTSSEPNEKSNLRYGLVKRFPGEQTAHEFFMFPPEGTGGYRGRCQRLGVPV
jgi:hypothetical protein